MRLKPFSDDELTFDAFLGGRLILAQPRRGYRAGLDPVLLAATIPARPGDSVLELGCGGGTGLCCLAARCPDVQVIGLDIQPGYAALARSNLQQTGARFQVHVGDVVTPPAALSQLQVHHVFANPPFFRTDGGTPAQDTGRARGRATTEPLTPWLQLAAKRLRPKGTVTLLLAAHQLPDALGAIDPGLGSVQVWPISARSDRAPHLVLLRARKGGRAAFALHVGLVLHEGDQHRDGAPYTPTIEAVLRDAAGLTFPQ